MDFKQASIGAITQLRSVYEKPRAKMLLDIALKHFMLEEGRITTSGGITVPASRFCVDVNYHMERFVPLNEVPADPAEKAKSMWAGIKDPQESYQIAALLLTLERMSSNTWGYGNKLRCSLDACGFKVTNFEWNAVMAQEYSFTASPFDKKFEKMFWRTPISIALYAAEFAAACGSLHNGLVSEKEIPEETMKLFYGAVRQNPKELLESMMQTFIPTYLGQERESQLVGFMSALNERGFYDCPASGDAHGNYDTHMNNGLGGGLLMHTIDVLYKLVDIVRPQTPIEMAICVIVAVCHDLSEVGAYSKGFRSEPVNGVAYLVQNGKYVTDEAGKFVVDQKRTLKWPDNQPYHLRTKVVWTRKDSSTVESGSKSLYAALWYFGNGSLLEEMSAAICCHKRNFQANTCCDDLMIHNTLCRSLHLADFLASMLGKKVV